MKNGLFYHCLPYLPKLNDGGMAAYLHSVLSYKNPLISPSIISSLKGLDQSKFRLLHIHGRTLLNEVEGTCPVVYTQHNHSSYCPSGTKYLAANKNRCDRNISYLGCTYGHLIERCGSCRPLNVLRNLKSSFKELEILKRYGIFVIANSHYVRSQLIANGLPPEQVCALSLGIQLPAETAQPLTEEIHRKQRILFVGRIVPEKGLEWLLKSLHFTSKDIHLDIAGNGWYRPKMELLSRQLGLESRITWHGWCGREVVNQLYRRCFAVVFPSIWPEPAGLVTLEAYSQYRPIIASSTGGIPEYIRDGKTGLLIQPNNVDALASTIQDLSINFEKSKVIGETGYSYLIEKYLIDVHMNRLKEIYEKVIATFREKSM